MCPAQEAHVCACEQGSLVNVTARWACICQPKCCSKWKQRMSRCGDSWSTAEEYAALECSSSLVAELACTGMRCPTVGSVQMVLNSCW